MGVTEDIVVTVSALAIFGLLAFSSKKLYDHLRWQRGWGISLEASDLRPSGDLWLMGLRISNNSGREVTVNGKLLMNVNDRPISNFEKIKGSNEPFKIEDGGYEYQTIAFKGEVREGENKGLARILAMDSKGDRRLNKKFSVYFEPE